MKYIIITPAKNEEKYIKNTLESVIAQTLQPMEWIIVNDGSTDNTKTIIEKYSSEHMWITLLNLNSANESRRRGSKVVRTFYAGYELIKDKDYDFIVKLDADLTLPLNYFQEVANCFNNNYEIGLCGGYCVIKKNGKLIKEGYSTNHVRGPIKAYRKQCFNEIGGLKLKFGWDGIDEFILRYKGWELKVLDLAVIHHRPIGQADKLIPVCFRSGVYFYSSRTDFLSLIYLSAKQLVRKPVLVGGWLYLIGYIWAFFRRTPHIVDEEIGTFMKKYRYKRMFVNLAKLLKCK